MLHIMLVKVFSSKFPGTPPHTVSGILHAKAGFAGRNRVHFGGNWGRACLFRVCRIRVRRHDVALQVSVMPTAESELRPDHRVRGCGVEHCNESCNQGQDTKDSVSSIS